MSEPTSSNRSSSVPNTITPTTPVAPAPPDAVNGTCEPSLLNRNSDRNDKLLGILNDIDALSSEALMKSDLPEQAKRLLDEIEASKTEPVTTAGTRRMQLITKDDSVKQLSAKLAAASQDGNIPTPYPIDKDPLGLEAWTSQANPDEVVAVADKFPQLRSALFSYVNATGVNHLTGMIHHGKLIDMELELFSKKQWRIIPAGDAVRCGPAANFIVLMKITLLHYHQNEWLEQVQQSFREFVELRSKEDIAQLIHCCKRFEWPPEINIAIPDKIAYADMTRDKPLEDMMVILLAPLLAMDESTKDLLNLLRKVNPKCVDLALQSSGNSHPSSDSTEG